MQTHNAAAAQHFKDAIKCFERAEDAVAVKEVAEFLNSMDCATN